MNTPDRLPPAHDPVMQKHLNLIQSLKLKQETDEEFAQKRRIGGPSGQGGQWGQEKSNKLFSHFNEDERELSMKKREEEIGSGLARSRRKKALDSIRRIQDFNSIYMKQNETVEPRVQNQEGYSPNATMQTRKLGESMDFSSIRPRETENHEKFGDTARKGPLPTKEEYQEF